MPRRRARAALAIPAPLTVETESSGKGPLRASVAGQLDHAGAQTMTRRLSEAYERLNAGESGDVILDFSAVSFIDSSGLRALLQAHGMAAERGGRMVLLAPGEAVRGVLALTGVEGHLEIADTPAEALALLARGRGR